MIVAAIVLFVLAVVLVGVTVAAAGGLLPLNSVAGIRVHYFLAGEDAWQAGHAAALLPVTIGGVVAVIGGIVCLAGFGSAGLVVLVAILFVAFLVWGVLRGDRAALDAVVAATAAE